MPGNTVTELGWRITTARKARRLTQKELGDLSATSLSMIRKVEQGSRTPSDDVLQMIAHALQVTPEHLLDGPGKSDSRVHLMIPGIREAIASYDLPDDGPVRAFDALATDVQQAVALRLNSQYAHLSERTAELIAELQRAVDLHTGADRQRAAALLASAYRSADAVAYKFGHRDLSGRLVELMRWASELTGDPQVVAAAAYVRTEVYFASGILGTGLRALQRAIDATPDPSAPQIRAATGALHMRAAVVAGRMRDANVARAHLAEASALTRNLREDVYCGTAVGPDSLQIHKLAVAVELADDRDLSTAVQAASVWAPPRNLPAERRSHYYIDLGRAQMQLGQPQYALESLEVARSIAPQHVREHGQVRDELATMVRLSRRTDERLLAFAQWARAV